MQFLFVGGACDVDGANGYENPLASSPFGALLHTFVG